MYTLKKIADIPGILLTCGGQLSALEFAYPADDSIDKNKWESIFHSMVTLLDLAQEDELRVSLEGHSLILRKEFDTFVGAVVSKGSPAMKSIQRMVRQALSSLGNPREPYSPSRPVFTTAF